MNFNRRLVLGFGLLACACTVHAQLPVPSVGGKLHVGYTTTGNFTLNDASSGRIVGPEFGLEIPVQKVAGGFSLNFYPSALIGASHSGGPQGNVYRFMLAGRQSVPGSQFYTMFAAGESYAHATDGAFDNVNAFETVVGGGLPLTGLFGRLNPSLEVAWHNANKGQFRGFTAGVSLAF